MPVVQQGAINTTALQIPDLYVQIVPPQTQYINGVATNILGIVGAASWGPVNSPAIIGDVASFVAAFGPIGNRKHDLGTAVALAALQGANNFRVVRVTDGADVAASATVQAGCLTFTSRYTGTFGNQVSVALSAGTQAGTWKVVAAAPGLVPECFDNVGAGLSGNALWAALADAINNGASALRGASQLIIASAGAGTAAPVVASFTLTGGTDGADGVCGGQLTGQDTVPRRGMYALRNTGASVAMLADCDDAATWSAQVAFGLSEGVYMILTGPSGDTIASAVSAKATAGIDSHAAKLLFGDWVLWNDTANGVVRVVSPQAPIAGLLANLSPEQSSLNKRLNGLVGTQKSHASQQYSAAELQTLGAAGIDLIANPVPGGKYFGARFGRNSGSNAMVHGDNYTRMTNYLANTLNAAMGMFVGELQSAGERRKAKATIDSFLANLEQQGMIGDADGGPAFSVVLDKTNNPPSRVALGYMQADCKVKYLSVIDYFLINVEGGQSVQIARAGTTLA